MTYLIVIFGIFVISLIALGVFYLIQNGRAPVPARDLADFGDFVSVDGIAVHLWREGRGRPDRVPVLLVHGFGASNWCWRYTVAELSKRYPVYAPDLPGFGLTDKPEGFDYTPAGYARFIATFMDKVGIEKAVLVGNSMGGGIATRTALAFPDRVQRLVLIDSLGYHKRGFHVYRFFGLPVVRDLIMALASPITLKFLLMTRVYHDPSRVDAEVARRFCLAYRTKNGRRAPLWVWRGLSPSPTIPHQEIRAIGAPTLVVWGRYDKILPPTHAGLFSRDIPRSRVVIIPDAGHVPHEERPEVVNPLIIDFIEAGSRSV